MAYMTKLGDIVIIAPQPSADPDHAWACIMANKRGDWTCMTEFPTKAEARAHRSMLFKQAREIAKSKEKAILQTQGGTP